MNGICNGTIFGVPAPWGPGEGPKGQISLNLNYKVNFQRFLNLLTNERYISDGIFIRPPGSGPGVGPGGTVGGGGGGGRILFPKLNQIWCVSYLHELHMHRHIFFGPQPLGRVQKFIFLNMVMWHIKLKGMSSRPGDAEKF